MTDPGERRFTDPEVALVLKRAADLEERRGGAGGVGLTLSQLEGIAREVGMDPALVAEAARDLAINPGGPRSLLGPSAMQRSVETVPGRLDEAALRELIDVVDSMVPQEGIVTTALGSVRWTGRDRFKGTQVAVGPAGEDTRIQVTQRYRARIRRLLHLLPGAMFGVWSLPIAGALALGPVGVAGVVAGAGLLGVGLGRGIWRHLARQSENDVKRLIAELVARAKVG